MQTSRTGWFNSRCSNHESSKAGPLYDGEPMHLQLKPTNVQPNPAVKRTCLRQAAYFFVRHRYCALSALLQHVFKMNHQTSREISRA